MISVPRRLVKPLSFALVLYAIEIAPAHAVVVDGKFRGRVSRTFASSDGKALTNNVSKPRRCGAWR